MLNSPTPAIVTQAAVQRLPRWALALLCFAYVLPGFIGREPWKTADASAYGIMTLMADGQTSWWNPTFMGQPFETPAWLPFALGATAMQWLPTMPELGSRLPYGIALALTLAFTWYSVYRFALLPHAQPVAFAFGGQAQPVDYARALADSGLMALMACLGLAQLSHEATPAVFQTASVACMLYALALIAHPTSRAHIKTRGAWVGGLLALGLSGQPAISAGLGLAFPLVWWLASRRKQAEAVRDETSPEKPKGVTGPWQFSTITGCAMAWLAHAKGTGLDVQTPGATDALLFGQMMIWFTWPTWPLCLWALWRWRNHLAQPHLLWPGVMVVAVASICLMNQSSDRTLMLALPAMATLASFSLPTLRRQVQALIDWFSVLFFSLSATAIWVIWIAMMTGYPKQPAANVLRLAPGFTAEFSLLAFGLAALATCAWLWIVAWRVGRHPPFIWKSLVLPATGVVLSWLLLMTLWLPLLNHARSYSPVARQIATATGKVECMDASGLSQGQAMGLWIQGQLPLHAAKPSSTCPYLLTPHRPEGREPLPGWTWQRTFFRLNPRSEGFDLFRRVLPTDPHDLGWPKQAESDPQAVAK